MDNMEEKILSTLGRFISIERASLMDEVLCGCYTVAAEKEFDAALVRLRDSGKAYNQSFYGFWAIPVIRSQSRREARRTDFANDSRRGSRRA